MTTQAPEAKDQKRAISIVVNGRKVTVKQEVLTFADVVKLSGLAGGEGVIFTVSYRKAASRPADDSMVEGGKPVKVKDGTIFNVSPTNRS